MIHARALLLLGVLLGAVATEAAAQLSPGPLSRAHAKLDQPAACFQCHARGGAAAMDQRCLACHTEVATMKRAGRGLHAREAKGACATCHPDHAGRDFALVRWEKDFPKGFDHARTGLPLAGAHTALECRQCHEPAFQRDPVAASIRVADRSKSWLGLQNACASCHRDPHDAALGTACQKCHDERVWKPAPRFDHARTAYPLTGRHAKVACASCHGGGAAAPADGGPAPIAAHGTGAGPRWKPLPHDDCASCHRDPHAGRFANACASCHRTESFSSIIESGFDHDRTRYPLRGRHAGLECASCHDPQRAWGKKPAFSNCGSCHQDAHAGQATIGGRAADCASCHRVEGFSPSTFTTAQHARTAYPLAGAHLAAACASCHEKAPAGEAAALGAARVRMKPRHEACTDCHVDPHRGRFTSGPRASASGCASCHGMERFRPSAMNVALHALSTFPLLQAHRAVPCQACHTALQMPPSPTTLRAGAARARDLRFEEGAARCARCHANPHGDQFAARADKGACESCHDAVAFAPAAHFDHERHSGFRLEGAHERTACASCHPSVRGSDGAARVVYRPISSRCESCHASGGESPRSGSGGRPSRPSLQSSKGVSHELL